MLVLYSGAYYYNNDYCDVISRNLYQAMTKNGGVYLALFNQL